MFSLISKRTSQSLSKLVWSTSIYVHWPYCKSICGYCDFNRYIEGNVDHKRMKDCLITELNNLTRKYLDPLKTEHFTHSNHPLNRPYLTSIYFGGGTPSLALPNTIESIINDSFQLFPAFSGFPIEITLEANPTSFEIEKFKEFKAIGVNRVSLGVQSLRDDQLEYLGRKHTANEAKLAIKESQKLFDLTSFDLIYARHNQQTLADWKDELREAFSLAAGHLSLYTLAFEPGTEFTKRATFKNHPKPIIKPDSDLIERLYEFTVEESERHGYEQYEVSNFSKQSNNCLHNMNYWEYGNFIGIGPGACSRLVTADGRIVSLVSIKHPKQWMEAVERNGIGVDENLSSTLNFDQILEEMLIMGMRYKFGISNDRFIQLFKSPIDQMIDKERINRLCGEGFLIFDENSIRPTKKGIAFADLIVKRLLNI